MSLVDTIHGEYVFRRRVRVLSAHLASFLPRGARVLDVGCGDGLIAKLILDARPDIELSGIDVFVRPDTHVRVDPFDGRTIPYQDGSFDVVMFVDVLHHTADPLVLLREACRVARGAVLLKDHCQDGWMAGPTLRFMDWIGNARHGVVLPYNYWPEQRWLEAFRSLGLVVAENCRRLHLYPWPASCVFERKLHFISRLEKKSS
jgi:SAM-dependent methyltransferase